jgi:signal transduction histidine kinase
MAAVGELSASIAHEIRNPLAAISGSVEVLLDELDVTGENRRLMELIVRESSRLNNILSDFLLYARSKRSAFTRVELCHLVSDVLQVIKHQPSYQNNMSIKFNASESFVYVFGDEDQIKQILINLIVNACEAIDPEKGEIQINIIAESTETALVEIKDNGPGIDPINASRLFAPFFSTKKEGTGMGLAIVQRLCGYLNIDLLFNVTPGFGAVFGLKFRRAPGLQALKKQTEPAVLAE